MKSKAGKTSYENFMKTKKLTKETRGFAQHQGSGVWESDVV
jgi:hypothetical protein